MKLSDISDREVCLAVEEYQKIFGFDGIIQTTAIHVFPYQALAIEQKIMD